MTPPPHHYHHNHHSTTVIKNNNNNKTSKSPTQPSVHLHHNHPVPATHARFNTAKRSPPPQSSCARHPCSVQHRQAFTSTTIILCPPPMLGSTPPSVHVHHNHPVPATHARFNTAKRSRPPQSSCARHPCSVQHRQAFTSTTIILCPPPMLRSTPPSVHVHHNHHVPATHAPFNTAKRSRPPQSSCARHPCSVQHRQAFTSTTIILCPPPMLGSTPPSVHVHHNHPVPATHARFNTAKRLRPPQSSCARHPCSVQHRQAFTSTTIILCPPPMLRSTPPSVHVHHNHPVPATHAPFNIAKPSRPPQSSCGRHPCSVQHRQAFTSTTIILCPPPMLRSTPPSVHVHHNHPVPATHAPFNTAKRSRPPQSSCARHPCSVQHRQALTSTTIILCPPPMLGSTPPSVHVHHNHPVPATHAPFNTAKRSRPPQSSCARHPCSVQHRQAFTSTTIILCPPPMLRSTPPSLHVHYNHPVPATHAPFNTAKPSRPPQSSCARHPCSVQHRSITYVVITNPRWTYVVNVSEDKRGWQEPSEFSSLITPHTRLTNYRPRDSVVTSGAPTLSSPHVGPPCLHHLWVHPVFTTCWSTLSSSPWVHPVFTTCGSTLSLPYVGPPCLHHLGSTLSSPPVDPPCLYHLGSTLSSPHVGPPCLHHMLVHPVFTTCWSTLSSPHVGPPCLHHMLVHPVFTTCGSTLSSPPVDPPCLYHMLVHPVFITLGPPCLHHLWIHPVFTTLGPPCLHHMLVHPVFTTCWSTLSSPPVDPPCLYHLWVHPVFTTCWSTLSSPHVGPPCLHHLWIHPVLTTCWSTLSSPHVGPPCLHHMLVHPVFTTCGSTLSLPHVGPPCLHHMLVHPVFTTCWSTLSSPPVDPPCLDHMLVHPVFTTCWSTLSSPPVDPPCLYHMLVHPVFTICWSTLSLLHVGPPCLHHLGSTLSSPHVGPPCLHHMWVHPVFTTCGSTLSLPHVGPPCLHHMCIHPVFTTCWSTLSSPLLHPPEQTSH